MISSPRCSMALISVATSASRELPARAPSSSRRDASAITSTCLLNRLKNFSSRGRSLIEIDAGEPQRIGITDGNQTPPPGSLSQFCNNREWLGRRLRTAIDIEEARIQQPLGIEIAHGG